MGRDTLVNPYWLSPITPYCPSALSQFSGDLLHDLTGRRGETDWPGLPFLPFNKWERRGGVLIAPFPFSRNVFFTSRCCLSEFSHHLYLSVHYMSSFKFWQLNTKPGKQNKIFIVPYFSEGFSLGDGSQLSLQSGI